MCLTLCSLWTVTCEAPLSMELFSQEYWSCRFLLQGIFPTQGSKPCLLSLLHWQVDFFYHSATWETQWSECTMPKCYILQVFTVHKCSTFCVFVKNSKKCDMENGIRLICLYMQNHVYSSNSFFQSFT